MSAAPDPRRYVIEVEVWASRDRDDLALLTDRIERHADDWLAPRGGERVSACTFEREPKRRQTSALTDDAVARCLEIAGWRRRDDGRWIAPTDPHEKTPETTLEALEEMAGDARHGLAGLRPAL